MSITCLTLALKFLELTKVLQRSPTTFQRQREFFRHPKISFDAMEISFSVKPFFRRHGTTIQRQRNFFQRQQNSFNAN